jgi:arabinose-5-phosphate isomerase
VTSHTIYGELLAEIDSKHLGFTCVVDNLGKLLGIITDGDLRRAQVKFADQVFSTRAAEIMTPKPKTISDSCLAVEALRVMEIHQIADLLIVNGDNQPEGIIHLKDLLRAGVV